MKPDYHLERAKALLAHGDIDSLIYAALEFRLCVESRLLEYSEFAAQFRKNSGSNWKAKDLASHVDSTYATKASVYSIEITADDIPNPITIRYIPVSNETVILMGRCDNYLHAAGHQQLRQEATQEMLRDILRKGIKNMEYALSGGMSGPLVRGEDGLVRVEVDPDKHPEMLASMKAGMPVQMRIEMTKLLE